MLAVGGTSCISLVSAAAADENSLTPLHRRLPTETASLGFGGNPVGGGDKSSRFAFFRHFCVRVVSLYPLAALSVSEQPRAGFISAEKRFSQSGCSAPMDACCSLLHTVLFRHFCVRWYHYPRCAIHAVETLDARGPQWLICRFYAAPEFALCGLNLPSSGTHATPAPNRAHSGSHAETRRVLRVDGDDVSGSGIIDTIDPFQADQPVAVALAEGHRDAVSP